MSKCPLIQLGDQLSEKVVIKGTNYRAGYVVVTKVFTSDIMQVGTILQIVLRKNSVSFLVKLSDAARNKFGFFETLPTNTLDLVQYEKLADFKPLIKRGDNICFPFVLHHHIPPALHDET